MTSTVTASPSLRERQKNLARRLIVEAASKVIVRSGIHQFSMQQVADEASVSLRTLYRYFASSEDLLNGVRREIEQGLQEVGLPQKLGPSITPAAVATIVVDAFRKTAQAPDIARAWVIINTVTGGRSESMRARDRAIGKVVEQFSPHLSVGERERLFGVVRYLASSLAWKVMTDDLGMDTEEVAQAVGWALRTLLEHVTAGGGPFDGEDRSNG